MKAPGNRGKKKTEDTGHRDENGQEAAGDRKARLGSRSQAQAHPRGIADAGVGTASVCLSLEVNDRHTKAAGPQSQA